MLSTLWTRRLQYLFIAIVTISVGFSLYQWNASRASTAKTAPNNGLVGYWSFNEGTGTLAGDASVNKNTGTLTGGPTWVSGKLGQALNFDGVNDYVNVPSPVITAYPATITAWVKVPAGAASGFPITITDSGDYNAWGIQAYTNQITGFTSDGYHPDSYLPLSADVTKWTFVSFVLTNTTSRTLYVNNLTPATDTNYVTTTSLDVLNIGRIGGNWASHGLDNWFTGQVDEVRIYNRALSGTEVTNLYNLGAAKLNTSPTASLTSGLVGYWTFDGKDTPWSSSSAGTATDRSGNSNTGTLTNMSRATSSVSGKLGQALNFDGVNDFVTLSNLAYTGATSLSAWIYPNTLSGRQVIVGRFDGGSSFPWSYGYGMVLESNCLHGISSNNYWGWYNNLCAAVQQGVWQHVVFTITGSSGTQTGSLYVDGVLRSSYAGTADPYSLYGPAIGYGEGNADGGYFNGKIDDVRSYNRALSAGEIQSLYDLGASDKVNSSVSQNQGTGRLDSGLVGYWPLDDGSGTNANDASTNNNDGTLTGGPTWGTGRIGGDVVFDGVNDYIDLGNRSVLNLTNDFTVSQWVKINNITQSDYKRFFGRAQIDDNNRPFYTEYNHLTNKYSAVWRNGGTFGGNSGKTVTSTQWHHFVVTFKDGKSKSYSDGVLIESSSGVVQPPSSSSNTGIGDIFSGYYFPGSIDEVRVYNRVLSDDEVSQLYRLTTPTGVDTSLKGYWSFNGKDTNWTSSSAGTVADLSGSGNTGTMTNMSRATSSVSGKIGQALNFDGVDDYVNAGGSSNFTSSDFSISYWMKLNSLSTNVGGQGPVPIYKGQFNTNGYYAQIQQNGAVGFFTCQSGATQSTGTAAGTIVTGRWYHIVHTRGGSSVRNYVDGVDQTTGPATHINPTSSGSNFMIGRYGDSGTIIYTNGIIDEVRTYSRALSAPEITALYNSGR